MIHFPSDYGLFMFKTGSVFIEFTLFLCFDIGTTVLLFCDRRLGNISTFFELESLFRDTMVYFLEILAKIRIVFCFSEFPLEQTNSQNGASRR